MQCMKFALLLLNRCLMIRCDFLQARRQQRKLNFLITQTELYAHFMARKMTGESDARRESILSQLNDDHGGGSSHRQVDGGVLVDVAGDTYSKLNVSEFSLVARFTDWVFLFDFTQ